MDLFGVLTWLHCVSKLTSHSYNNLYLLKNHIYFTEKNNFHYLSNSDSWKAKQKGLTFRRDQDCARTEKRSSNRFILGMSFLSLCMEAHMGHYSNENAIQSIVFPFPCHHGL